MIASRRPVWVAHVRGSIAAACVCTRQEREDKEQEERKKKKKKIKRNQSPDWGTSPERRWSTEGFTGVWGGRASRRSISGCTHRCSGEGEITAPCYRTPPAELELRAIICVAGLSLKLENSTSCSAIALWTPRFCGLTQKCRLNTSLKPHIIEKWKTFIGVFQEQTCASILSLNSATC